MLRSCKSNVTLLFLEPKYAYQILFNFSAFCYKLKTRLCNEIKTLFLVVILKIENVDFCTVKGNCIKEDRKKRGSKGKRDEQYN